MQVVHVRLELTDTERRAKFALDCCYRSAVQVALQVGTSSVVMPDLSAPRDIRRKLKVLFVCKPATECRARIAVASQVGESLCAQQLSLHRQRAEHGQMAEQLLVRRHRLVSSVACGRCRKRTTQVVDAFQITGEPLLWP